MILSAARSYPLAPMLRTVFYLISLVTGFSLAGWLLTCFQGSIWIWLGTIGTIAYIAKAKTGAIASASAWVVLLISIPTVTKAWPTEFSQQFPPMLIWAGTLLLLWLFGVGLVLLLAFSDSILRSPNISVRMRSILPTFAAFLGLILGFSLSVTAL